MLCEIVMALSEAFDSGKHTLLIDRLCSLGINKTA